MTTSSCLPPVFIGEVFGDPKRVRRLVEANAPYLPVQRYFNHVSEYRALSGRATGDGAMIVAPNFRGNWADGAPLVDGAESILDHPPFVEAAARLFGCPIVRPWLVYVNLTWQLPFAQGAGHTDIPAFRGVDRTRHPLWLLTAMGRSGLFEAERIRIATAVAWFYTGTDGGFTYWPDGPDAPPRVHEGRIFNTAFVGDNDRMFHRVRPVGRREAGLPRGMSLDTRLERRGGSPPDESQPVDSEWALVDHGRTLAELPFEALRISLSWKAAVFADEAEARRVDDHESDLDLDEVIERFDRDLAARDVKVEWPADPLTDPATVDLLSHQYVRTPTIHD